MNSQELAPLTQCKGIHDAPAKYASLGIIAWNEEEVIGSALESLFQQSFFTQLASRGLHCEVICIANGCTDGTAQKASGIFTQQSQTHPARRNFSCQVISLSERGKLNAWNHFVHEFSARNAQVLFLLDADILLHRKETLWNMLAALQNDPQATVAVDRPCKDIRAKDRKRLRDHLSLAASQLTTSSPAQLCAQLYCIRSKIARNIYLPKDLPACEDGFIKALVCTDFLAHDVLPQRIRLAERAEHTFEAYTSFATILRNQKRQVLGQTVVHLLVDHYLKSLPSAQGGKWVEALQQKDALDPDWLKRLLAQHLEQIQFFWQLYPGLLRNRFSRLRNLSPARKFLCLPAAVASFGLGLLASFMAYRSLKSGCIDYWPSAPRHGLSPAAAPLLDECLSTAKPTRTDV